MVAWLGHKAPKRPHTVQEGRKKILKTVDWYNRNGNLVSEIDVKDVRTVLFAIEPHKALEILKGLDGQGDSIENPTQWIKEAAEEDVPQLDAKVGKTLNWYMTQGKLQQDIEFEAVRPLLACLPPHIALEVLGGLNGKEETINNPTAWLIRAAESHIERLGDEVLQAQAAEWPAGREGTTWTADGIVSRGPIPSSRSGPTPSIRSRPVSGSGSASSWGSQSHGASAPAAASASASDGGELDAKVAKAITWYNHHGGLQQKIDFNEVTPFLSQLPVETAARIVHGLDGKSASIRDPTWWLIAAAKRHTA